MNHQNLEIFCPSRMFNSTSAKHAPLCQQLIKSLCKDTRCDPTLSLATLFSPLELMFSSSMVPFILLSSLNLHNFNLHRISRILLGTTHLITPLTQQILKGSVQPQEKDGNVQWVVRRRRTMKMRIGAEARG